MHVFVFGHCGSAGHHPQTRSGKRRGRDPQKSLPPSESARKRFRTGDHPMKPVQIRMARAALGWEPEELAGRAGLQAAVLERIELGSETDPTAVAKLQAAFEAEGVVFLDADETGGPGVRAADVSLPTCEGIRPEDLNASNDG
jgi:ribosome-binding protein aMBF1 (putative translation factor)